MDSNKLAECFQNTMEIAASDMMKRYRRQTERSSKVYPEKYKSEKKKKEIPGQIIVEENTTLAAARKYLSENKTAVLNFANPVTPGGSVLKGDSQLRPYEEWKRKNVFYGKQISILGDSISTLAGYNPGGYSVFYEGATCEQTNVHEFEDTWWGKVINYFGGALLVNNSWSGSRVTRLPGSDRLFPSGCSDERTGGLHINSTMPDVILVYLGTNDWAYGVMAEQNPEANTKRRLFGRKSAQQDESVFSFAYNKMLTSLRKNYPQAEILCCTLCETKIADQPSFQFPHSYGGTHIDVFNRIIRETAAQNGCMCLNLGYYHIPYDSVDGTHPTAAGMNTLAILIIREICSLRNEKNVFIDCAPDEHEFFTLEEYTGASEYVCRKCGLLKGVVTPYPGVSPFELEYAGSTLNGKPIGGSESHSWNGAGAGPAAGNPTPDKAITERLFVQKQKKLCIQNDPINKLQADMPSVFHFSIPKGDGAILTRIRQQTEKGAVCIAKVVDDYLAAEQRETKIIYAGGELVFQAAYDGPMINRRFEFRNELKETAARILVIPGDNEAYVEYDGRRIFMKRQPMTPPVVRFDPDAEWGEGCEEMRPTVVYQMTEDLDLYHYETVINGHLPEPLVMILLSLIFTGSWG